MDTERGLYEIHGNEGQSASGGAGINAAQCLVNMGVEAVVTGNVGPNALGILSAAGIPVYRGAGIPVSEALEQFKQGILEEISQAVPKHYGLNMGGK
jgi:predicted Fe-Mo cluster-binding NifX family protein